MSIGIFFTLIILTQRKGNLKAPPKFNHQFNHLPVNKRVMTVFPKFWNVLESPGRLLKPQPHSVGGAAEEVHFQRDFSGCCCCYSGAHTLRPTQFGDHGLQNQKDWSQSLAFSICFMCDLEQVTEAELLIHKGEHCYRIRSVLGLH